MRDALNFFEPYESLPPTHENQLTRSFLVVLKLVPIAHAVWLRMVSDSREGATPLASLERLPMASFNTQTSQIGSTEVAGAGLDETSDYRAVSVLQAGDLLPNGTPAGPSDRLAIFDGVVRYGDDLALVIESKLDGLPDERQAEKITIGETAWRVDPHRARLQWRDIIAAWRNLLQQDLVSGAERKVLEDFMWLVQRHFPKLQPFSELSACRSSGYLVRLRCKAILDDLGSAPAEVRLAGPPQSGAPTGASLVLETARTVRLAGLESDAETMVRLRMFPGDTLEQAEVLYADRSRVRQLLSLQELGWDIWPNFHFGHMAKGFVWTSGNIDTNEYVEHWLENIDATGQIPRKRWKRYFDELVKLRIASESDREAFDRDFTQTKRSSATPRPGLGVQRRWPFDSAAELDRSRRFGAEVRDSINAVLAALSEPTI